MNQLIAYIVCSMIVSGAFFSLVPDLKELHWFGAICIGFLSGMLVHMWLRMGETA